MTLDESQWHVRWFRWNQRVLDRFAHRDEDHSYDRTYKGTDLCTYMRTIVLGTMVTTEMVLFEWLRSAEHPQFKAVQALIK